MRKIFYTVFSISQICFLLLYPQEALAASKEGMQLWLNVLLPVLLPFLILTGILIHTNMAGKLLQPVEVIWNKVLGVSAAGAYAVIVGALCGYPVGAKIISDLYENHQISESEAKYLLTFTNHASPVFVRICVISVSKIRFLHEQCLEYLHCLILQLCFYFDL